MTTTPDPAALAAMRKDFERYYRDKYDSRLYCESEWRGFQAGRASLADGAEPRQDLGVPAQAPSDSPLKPSGHAAIPNA